MTSHEVRIGSEDTYGVMGMLERIREPSRPPLGVAPPGALRAGADVFSLVLDDDELSTSKRRNCSLFMVALASPPGPWTVDVVFKIEKVPAWRLIR